MKALSLWQPWASLCVLPHAIRADGMVPVDPTHLVPASYCAPGELPVVKRIETRSWPPPQKLIGQTIAIHAAKRKPDFAAMKTLIADRIDVWNAWHAAGLVSEDGSLDRIPLGAVVGTVRLWAAAPMVDTDSPNRPARSLILAPSGVFCSWYDSSSHWYDVSDQIPFGHFEHGRWGWLFDQAQMFDEPIPAVGHQGVWEWQR